MCIEFELDIEEISFALESIYTVIPLTLTTLWHINIDNIPLEKKYNFFKAIQFSY